MGRRHNFPASGEAQVQMDCDQCGKTELVRVVFHDVEDPCLVEEAVEQSSWQWTHDAVVCSDGCAADWWNWY